MLDMSEKSPAKVAGRPWALSKKRGCAGRAFRGGMGIGEDMSRPARERNRGCKSSAQDLTGTDDSSANRGCAETPMATAGRPTFFRGQNTAKQERFHLQKLTYGKSREERRVERKEGVIVRLWQMQLDDTHNTPVTLQVKRRLHGCAADLYMHDGTQVWRSDFNLASMIRIAVLLKEKCSGFWV